MVAGRERRLRKERNLMVAGTLMKCAECHKVEEAGLVHTWLFCELFKAGWDRRTIETNVLATADALRDRAV